MPQNLSKLRMLGFLGLLLLGPSPDLLAHPSAQATRYPGTLTATPTVRPLRDVLNELKNQYSVDILFGDQLVQGLTVSGDVLNPKGSLEQNLQAALHETGLKFRKAKSGAYLITGKRTSPKLTSASAGAAPGGLMGSNQSGLPPATDAGSLPSASTLLIHSTSVGQAPADQTITGRVTDSEKGEALPGVSVVLKVGPSHGSKRGTTTDGEGRFRLTVPDGDSGTLVFSYVGYLPQEVPLGARSTVDVQLVVDNKTLSEVVVVGYGTVKKSDLTGSLSQVKTKELTAFPTTNLTQALQGRSAGVQVIQNNGAPGGPISVRIRGTNSIQGSNEPLYVVDGFPYTGSPNLLNNADIETIEILKDASATAIYGSRGANGVILITTKRGKAGRTTVDYEGSYSVQSPRKLLALMNAQEYARFYNEQAANDAVQPYFTQDQINGFGEGVDWQREVLQKAPMQNHNLTVSGGTDKTQFSVSGGYFGQDGIVKNSHFDRYSLRANVNHDISKRFTLSYNTLLTRIQSQQQNSEQANRGNSLQSAMISVPPTLSPFNDDGTLRVLGTAYPFISAILTNPFNYINEQKNLQQTNQMLANVALTIRPFAGLSLRISGGIQNDDGRNDTYRTRQFVNSQGSATIGTGQTTSLLNENVLTYTRLFRKNHNLTITAGQTYQQYINTGLSASGTGFVSDVAETYDLGAATLFGTPATSYQKWTLLSYLGRVNYSYKSKYLLTASFRADGSSRYSKDNKWGYFPSGALAWRIVEEPFLKDVRFLSDLKLRAGYGATGSTAINPYSTLNVLSSDKAVFNDALFTSYGPGSRLPGDLRWETTEQMDIGLDAGFFSNRLRVTADYYVKNTSDLLNTVQLPGSLGYTSVIRNIGKIQNRGLELSVDADVLTGSANAVKWTVSGNISFNRNRVVSLNGGQDIPGSVFNNGLVNDYVNLLREGQPLGVFYGYLEKGYSEKGILTYQDLDGDGLVNIRDKTYIGDPNPAFIYGFNSALSFRNFEFTLFVQGSQGNDIFNLSSVTSTTDFGFGLNTLRAVYEDHWTPTTPTARYPKITQTQTVNMSNRFVEDGSYLRFRQIQLAYNLPQKVLSLAGLRSVQLYASGQNLLTLTNYSWFDPEINSYGGASSFNQGVDHYSYPTAKTITFGLRAGF